MIVAAQPEYAARISEDRLPVHKRPHRRVADHAGNLSVVKTVLFRARLVNLPVRAVSIVIPAARLVDARILKQIGHVDRPRLPDNADHVGAKLDHSPRARSGSLSLRHTAAEIQISSPVVIHQHSRVKQPEHVRTVWCLPGDQPLSQRIPERSRGRVRLQDTDPAARVRKIEEKLVFPVNLLPRRRRRPRISRPLRNALAGGRVHRSVICKIDHIIRRDHVDLVDLAVCVLLDALDRIVLKRVRGHIDVHPVLVNHRIRIRAEPLRHQRIRVIYALVALRYR